MRHAVKLVNGKRVKGKSECGAKVSDREQITNSLHAVNCKKCLKTRLPFLKT